MVLNKETIPFVLLCLQLTQGLRVTNIEVPRYIMVGDTATLKCHFILEGEKLYSLNWWKDDRQFYQYIPRNDPKKVVYNIPGVSVNEQKSSLYSVELVDIQKRSKGEYRCEVVGEAPTFATNIRRANLSIIDPPDGPPVVRGQKNLYHQGEVIRLNCTSYRSRPAPHLTWSVLKDVRVASLSSPPSLGSPSFAFLKSSSSSSSSSSLFLLSNSSSPASSTSSSSRSLSSYSSSSFSSALFKLSSRLSSLSLYGRRDNGDSRFHGNNPGPRGASLDDSSMTSSNEAGDMFLQTSRNMEKKVFKRDALKKASSNYTKVDDKYLINYPSQTVNEEGMPPVDSVTLGIQFPASLASSFKGRLTLRCAANISRYTWATEVRIDIAKVPVADPQQLPTLHGTGSPRGLACKHHKHHLEVMLIINIILSKMFFTL